MTSSPAITTPKASTIAQSLRSAPTAGDPNLKKNVEKWVAQTFFGTLMKQMRESPFKSDLFDGGKGGQAFGSMYDQELAQRMSRGVGEKLVNSILRKIEGKAAYDRAKIARSGNSSSSSKGVSNVAPNRRA